MATCESLLKAAIDIAYRLNNEAIHSPDGSCSWITTGIVPGTEKYRMQPMGMFVYDGFAGVAMFLSALSTVTHDPVIHRIGEAALVSLKRTIGEAEKSNRFMKMNPIGIASGLTSLIYSFLTISDFAKDSTLVDGALAISRLIDKTIVIRDNSHDVMSGNAGAILALLKLYRKTGLQEVLDKAIDCGDHLLETAIQMPDGNMGWITVNGKALAGFSHGVAGIAYSLLKLHEATGNMEYYEIAAKSIRYENGLFSVENQNWADLRVFQGTVNPDSPKFMTAWCHGAAGIGLGRMAGKPLFNNNMIESDISSALATTRNTSLTNRDHLCCGNMGRIEAILYAALKTNDKNLLNEACEKAGFVIERAEKRGHYDIFADQSLDFFNPGFFQGLSGIGYEFLRLAYPDQFPSVLVFE
ncbi:MAG: type 2 lanthipeptide synthetase LanM [Bacteroidales bacterium]